MSLTLSEVMRTLAVELPYPEVKFYPKVSLKQVSVHFGSHVDVLYQALGFNTVLIKNMTIKNRN